MVMGFDELREDAMSVASELSSRHNLTAVITLGAKGALASGPTGQFRVGACRSVQSTPPALAMLLSVSLPQRSIRERRWWMRLDLQASVLV